MVKAISLEILNIFPPLSFKYSPINALFCCVLHSTVFHCSSTYGDNDSYHYLNQSNIKKLTLCSSLYQSVIYDVVKSTDQLILYLMLIYQSG